MKPESFAQLYEEAKKQDAYWVADAIYTFTEELHNLAEIGKVSRTELARRMEVSPAYITKIFRGDVNFTIDTMVRLARRVGARLHLHLAPETQEAGWVDHHAMYRKEPFPGLQAEEAMVSEPAPKAPKRKREPLPSKSGSESVRKVRFKSKAKKILDQVEGEPPADR